MPSKGFSSNKNRLFLAILLIAVVAGVVVFSKEGPTGFLTSYASSITSSSATLAWDAPSVTYGFFRLNKKLCSSSTWQYVTDITTNSARSYIFTGLSSGTCYDFRVIAMKGTPTSYSVAQYTSPQSVRITTSSPATTTYSATRTESLNYNMCGGSCPQTRTIEFDQEYLNVGAISFSGSPGGWNCGAAINLKAYNAAGAKVAEGTTSRVGDHKTASISLSPSNVKVKRIVGTTVEDNDYWSWDCKNLDSLSATLTMSDDKNGPKITPQLTVQKHQVSSSGPYASYQTDSVTITAALSDSNGYSETKIFIDNSLVKTCGTGTSICTYVDTSIPSSVTKKNVKIEAKDNTPSKNLNTVNTYYKVGQFSFCIGAGC